MLLTPHRFRPGALKALLLCAMCRAAASAALALDTPVQAALPEPIAQALSLSGIPPEAVGLVVAPVGAGPRHLDWGADRSLQPASTLKLLTTLAALETLGPTWRGRTRLLATGPLVDGVLHGDLVLEGGADMDLSADALRALLRRAREGGLREVRGELLLDRTAFFPERLDQGMPPFDDGPEFEYNLIPDALVVDSNLLRLELGTDPAGQVRLLQRPGLHGVRVVSELQVIEAPCGRWGDGWKTPEIRQGWFGRVEVVLRGTWPRGCERSLALNLIDRDDYIARLVRQQWTELGGAWSGQARAAAAPPDARVLAERQSRPLADLVRDINKVSDNARTRTLLLALGRASGGAPQEPTLQRAERALRAWMTARGIPDAGFVLDNGSGLSRTERISAGQLEAVVRAGLSSRWAPEFLASLPVVGVDGLMRWRQPDGSVPLQARLKPGGLRNVVSVAGTVHDAAGQPQIVVLILNHERAGAGRPVVDALLRWVSGRTFEPAPGASR